MNSELLFFIYITIGISSPIIWACTRFWGHTGMFVSVVVISAIFSCIITVLHGMAAAWSTSGSSVTRTPFYQQTHVTMFVLSLVILLFVSYGIHHFVQYNKTGQLQKLPFFIWLTILVSVPSSIHLREYWQKYYKNKHYGLSTIDVSSPVGLPIFFESITFINSRQKTEGTISLHKITHQHYKEPQNLAEHFEQANDEISLRDKVYIPKDADKFIASWYSFAEEKYYQDEFPLPEDSFRLFQNYDKSWSISNLNLRIYRDGYVDLFTTRDGNKTNLRSYFDVATLPLPTQVQEQLAKEHNQLHDYGDRKNREDVFAQYKGNTIRPELNKSAEFHIRFKDHKKIKYVYIYDTHGSRLTTKPKGERMYSKSMPWAVAPVFRESDEENSIHFMIYFDPKEFYTLIEKLPNDVSGKSIEIELSVEQRVPAKASAHAYIGEEVFPIRGIYAKNGHP